MKKSRARGFPVPTSIADESLRCYLCRSVAVPMLIRVWLTHEKQADVVCARCLVEASKLNP